MKKSFDIHDADTENTLIQLCKTNLKANQALDCGDIETYQKLARVQESLRKTAKFTAAQNKEKEQDFISCVGELVAYCEKYGGRIPKYEITVPLDIVDRIIDDQKAYTKSLVYQDTSLAQQIEDYLRQRKIMDERRREKEIAKAEGTFTSNQELSDKDYEQYLKDLETFRESDDAVYAGGDE